MQPLGRAGVVHGDLKAANVLLTRAGEDVGRLWARTLGYRVTAKVADFGLALQLDPKDTHATMAARVGGRALSVDFGCQLLLPHTFQETAALAKETVAGDAFWLSEHGSACARSTQRRWMSNKLPCPRWHCLG
jgi:serine/threonine protein kinase